MEVVAALLPPLVVAGVFIYGLMKLIRYEASGKSGDRDLTADTDQTE